MDTQNFSVLNLEKHVTKDMKDSHVNGELTVVWRDWDNIIKNPEMIYVNIVNPGEVKGPHVHKKSRQQYRIDSYCGFFSVLINDKQDYIKFQSLKKKLYESCIDQGFDVTFRHSKKEKLRLFGSND